MLRQCVQLRLFGSQCVSNALVVPSVLLGAACGVAEALTSEAGEAAASALNELQAVLSEVLGHDAIKGFVLRPLLRLWRSRTVRSRACLQAKRVCSISLPLVRRLRVRMCSRQSHVAM